MAKGFRDNFVEASTNKKWNILSTNKDKTVKDWTHNV